MYVSNAPSRAPFQSIAQTLSIHVASLAKRPRSWNGYAVKIPCTSSTRQRLVRRLDVELHVAVRAPEQRLEAPVRAAVGPERVVHAADRAPFDVVAISLPSLRVEQRLGVGER